MSALPGSFSNEPARLLSYNVPAARFSRLDRRIREITSPLDARQYACHPRLVNGYPETFSATAG
jgi:hypothetical protein